jgi:acetyl esterase/lipase
MKQDSYYCKHVRSAAAIFLLSACAFAQSRAPLPPLPAPQGIPAPGPAGSTAYAPQPIVPGGIIVPLYPPNSPMLKQDRVRESEKYNMSQNVPGRITSIVNIHNPSIEIHKVESGINTGAVVILAAGGGHRTLNVGGEAAAYIPFLYNYGVNCVILRNRLRSDGYEPQTDAVNDALQAIRMVRAYAKELSFDPNKIGIMGFSAGGELSAPAAVLYDEFDKKNNDPADPFAGITSRPDFSVMIYTGPTPFAANRTAPPIPKNVPPSFLATPGSGDRIHAIWTMEYFSAMLAASVPNIELHIYGNGVHGGSSLDRGGIPFGTWQYRFIDWFRDLGFLQKPGVVTKAANDVAAYVSNPPRPPGPRPGTRPEGAAAPSNPNLPSVRGNN